jgi:hypothetical protein
VCSSIGKEHVGEQVPDTFGQFASDPAVEIVSPGDSVWLINPKLQRATVYRADGSVSVVRADGALDGEAVLPGFTCPLSNLLQD